MLMWSLDKKSLEIPVYGRNAWERRSHTFTFCYKMSLKLFQNGEFFGCVPTLFLLALHPWLRVL